MRQVFAAVGGGRAQAADPTPSPPAPLGLLDADTSREPADGPAGQLRITYQPSESDRDGCV